MPAGALAGAALGLALALAGGGWPAVVLLAFLGAATAGTIAGAVEDGRVQRQIDARRRDPGGHHER